MNEIKDNQKQEFINIKEELNIDKKEEKTVSKKRKTRRIIVGAIFSFFALVGVISIISMGINTTAVLLDNTEEKAEYAQKLSTLALYDPLPVEDVSLIDEKILYLSGIWAAVINEDMTQYEQNEYGETMLPAIVVDSYIESIFGPSFDLVYKTFDDAGITYIFDEEKQAYVIPVTSIPTGYTIEVAEIEQQLFASEKTLTVAYLAAATSWENLEETEIVKYVDYVFEKQNDGYFLVAIRESEKEVETLPTASTEPTPIPVPELTDATPPPAAADVASSEEVAGAEDAQSEESVSEEEASTDSQE